MAKMRVHELAKELNIKSQEVIDTLNGTQFAVKNVQSGLEDEAQQIVRKKYAKTEAKKDAPKKEEPKKDEAKAADRPKKKASITAGGIKAAVEAARKTASFTSMIEVETEDLDMVAEALEAGADIIMLDNMDHDTMARAIELIGDRALTECSGNITRDNVQTYIDLGVDFISSGALTHSAGILDLSMKNLRIEA